MWEEDPGKDDYIGEGSVDFEKTSYEIPKDQTKEFIN
jgi:hypothetical protein